MQNILQAEQFRPCIVFGKPPAKIELPQVIPDIVRNRPLPAGYPTEIRVMKYNGNAVCCKLHVQLDALCAIFQCLIERSKRVFRSDSHGSPVSDKQGTGIWQSGFQALYTCIILDK